MKCDNRMMRLYAVTDRSWTGRQSLAQQVEAALKGGVTCVQLREKALSEEAFLAEALEIRELCSRYGVPFIINDNVDIAIACKADGVHVGQEDMAAAKVRQRVGDDMIIGVSAHTVAEALEAVKHGADYLGSGAVFGSATKTNVQPMSRQTLADICAAVDIPVVAIGGITRGNLPQLKGLGLAGAAVVSALFAQPDVRAAAEELRRLSEDILADGKT